MRSAVHEDTRGTFVKPFSFSAFAAAGLPVAFREAFFSRSRRRVVRGLHFQTPPHAQDKLVCCAAGRVLDVVVDLRVGSPTYGRAETFELDAETWTALFIPAGLAHGFAALADDTVMAYAVTAEYDPKADSGIRWDSVPVEWPWPDPVVSERDMAFAPLAAYASPFRWRAGG